MRTDFLVRYGFAGPVVMEVKLTSHSDAKARDVTTTKSYRSMARYMEGYGASQGLLIAIANEEPARLERLAQAFRQIPNVGAVTFDLTKGITVAVANSRRPSSRHQHVHCRLRLQVVRRKLEHPLVDRARFFELRVLHQRVAKRLQRKLL